MERVKKYGVFELCLKAAATKPFAVLLSAVVTCPNANKRTVRGFYDGDGCYRLRFMPEAEGSYSFVTKSDLPELNGKSGEFLCEGVSGHGKVQPDGLFLKHADGSRHLSFGTTCYAWLYQTEAVRRETIKTLSEGYFNKVRMCVFPKWYLYNENQPDIFPFAGEPGNFDYNSPNPVFFQRLDEAVLTLGALGIQADIILFHPYDYQSWGFSKMTPAQDCGYIRYVTARLGAYANVWYSAANEYDLFRNNYKQKRKSWKQLVKTVHDCDSFGHMLGIHQCLRFYNHSDSNITHCSLQRTGMYVSTELTGDFIRKYRKPVIWDEINYEGNMKPTFGSCTPQELVRHFWEAAVRGAGAGHGETYLSGDGIIWWAKGGTLHGESHYRIRFLRMLMEEYGLARLTCCQGAQQLPEGKEEDDILIWYYGNTQSEKQDIFLPPKYKYEIEIVDTWNMQRRKLDGVCCGTVEIPLGGKPYMAVFAKKTGGAGLPGLYDADCLLRDLRHYKGGKRIYRLLTKTPILKGNEFVLYDTLSHLQEFAGGALSDCLIGELCGYANDGRALRHIAGLLKKSR